MKLKFTVCELLRVHPTCRWCTWWTVNGALPIWKCQDCHKVVTRWSQARLLQACYQFVPRLSQVLSQGCHKVIMALSQGCQMVITALSQGCYTMHGCS